MKGIIITDIPEHCWQCIAHDVDIDSYDYERWEGKVTFCDECDEKFKIGDVEVDYYSRFR